MIRVPRLQTLSALFIIIGWPLAAELEPLALTITDNTERSYQFVRCASFYTANLEWAGTQLSEALYEESAELIRSLISVAVLVRGQTNDGKAESIAANVMSDARLITDVYLEQYRGNYALTGNAWDGNGIWEADASFCNPIGQATLELTKTPE